MDLKTLFDAMVAILIRRLEEGGEFQVEVIEAALKIHETLVKHGSEEDFTRLAARVAQLENMLELLRAREGAKTLRLA